MGGARLHTGTRRHRASARRPPPPPTLEPDGPALPLNRSGKSAPSRSAAGPGGSISTTCSRVRPMNHPGIWEAYPGGLDSVEGAWTVRMFRAEGRQCGCVFARHSGDARPQRATGPAPHDGSAGSSRGEPMGYVLSSTQPWGRAVMGRTVCLAGRGPPSRRAGASMGRAFCAPRVLARWQQRHFQLTGSVAGGRMRGRHPASGVSGVVLLSGRRDAARPAHATGTVWGTLLLQG
ncbi:hypothetical protein H4V95_000286 [Arthrobacter sp. CAN_C5]|nr:hypothetical protein [Arthrobacter sp. CAN_C5]